ncbi:MAG TPA: DUF4249 family protein [Cytophagales bacterium]|nr:DUF4249 family protein [Cytophagales bacterium]
MKNIKIYIAIILAVLGLLGCNLKKEIDLNLPPYKSQYLVECYLIPGKKYRLLLSQSTSIQNEIPLNPLVFATARIYHNNDTIVLDDFPEVDQKYSKFYNYTANEIVEYDTVHPYYLEIKIQNTDVVLRAQTKFLRKPKVNPIIISTRNDLDFSLNVSTQDVDPTQINYYMFQIMDSSDVYDLESRPRNRSYLDDRLISNNNVGIYTSFKYGFGEAIIAKIYHLTPEHYEFLTSIDEAQNANGNPFGRPTFVSGNVSGGVGIFTSINHDEKSMTIGH